MSKSWTSSDGGDGSRALVIRSVERRTAASRFKERVRCERDGMTDRAREGRIERQVRSMVLRQCHGYHQMDRGDRRGPVAIETERRQAVQMLSRNEFYRIKILTNSNSTPRHNKTYRISKYIFNQ